jgi:hypothetical protein
MIVVQTRAGPRPRLARATPTERRALGAARSAAARRANSASKPSTATTVAAIPVGTTTRAGFCADTGFLDVARSSTPAAANAAHPTSALARHDIRLRRPMAPLASCNEARTSAVAEMVWPSSRRFACRTWWRSGFR